MAISYILFFFFTVPQSIKDNQENSDITEQ